MNKSWLIVGVILMLTGAALNSNWLMDTHKPPFGDCFATARNDGRVFAKGMWESMPLADTHRDTLNSFGRQETEESLANWSFIQSTNEWDIPRQEVLSGGPGKDGIPALLNPRMIDAREATYLRDNDLVVGYKRGQDIRAYPHGMLNWHEIINDEVDGIPLAIVYCPLTGTATGWDRTLNGMVTTFGVSGLLYNSNVIPYDRLTGSYWSQLRLNSVNGRMRGHQVKTFNTIETTWKTWKMLFPETRVQSTATGYNRSYDYYPYGDYQTNNQNLIFPFKPHDSRLDAKEKVMAVIINGKAKAYRFKSFSEGYLHVVEDNHENKPLVVAGSKAHRFLVAFERMLPDGTLLKFYPVTQGKELSGNALLKDNEGNVWDAFGIAVEGPRKGQSLNTPLTIVGYWFSFGAFYPGLDIYKK